MADAAGSTIGELTKVFKLIGKAGTVVTTAAQIFEFLTDDTPTDKILNAITALEQAVVSEMNKIIQAISDETWQQEWQPFADEIAKVQRETAIILSDLGTIQEGGDGYVIQRASDVDFDVWAATSIEPGKDGALTILWDNMESIWSLFQSGGIANASMLDTWESLFKLGESNIVQNFDGQHQLSAYFLLMQQINGMISQIFFLHETILALYDKQYGNPQRMNSLGPKVAEWFGDVSTAGSVWAMFDAKMTFQPEVLKDLTYTATALDCLSINSSPTYYRIADPGSPVGSYLWTEETTTQGYGAADKAFFVDLRIARDETTPADWPSFYLLGKLVQVQPGGSFSDPVEYSSYVIGTSQDSAGLKPFPIPGNEGDDGLWYVNVGYPESGLEPTSANQFQVLTGFRFGFWNLDNLATEKARLILYLQYGILDLTDIDAPTVLGLTEFKSGPEYYFGTFGEGNPVRPEVEFWNLDYVGNAAGFPIDNVSFSRVHNDPLTQWNGNEVGLWISSNWTVHRADFMQPTNSLVPHAYKPSA